MKNNSIMALLLSAAAGLAAGPAMADTYVGGALGQGRITVNDPQLGADQFKQHHTAFKLFGGISGPVDLEFEYVDFGKSRSEVDGEPVSGKLNALGAFAMLSLRPPVPSLDVYGKLGFARLDRKISGDLLDLSSRNTEFAWGAGAQFKTGSIAVRVEYERFKTEGRDPTLLSLGFVKYFGD